MNNKNRVVYYEVMRIIAIAFVLFNHLPGYSLYINSSGARQYLYVAISMFTRFNVHLFMMVSGALLLRKTEDYSIILRKRIPRFAFIIILSQLLLYLLYYVRSLSEHTDFDLSFGYFIRRFLAGDLEYSYWFLYAYLGFLFMLPLIQRIAQGLKKQDVLLLTAVHFVFFTIIPLINLILSLHSIDGLYVADFFSIPFATVKIIFYALIGYYLDNNIDIKSLHLGHIISIIAAMLLGIAISGICTFAEGISTGKFTYNYVEMFEFVTTTTVFLLIKYTVTRLDGTK
ncbi:MAG: acyltransferase, partial [Lachnospiraceae bacterium]|nr:acyltransferase [Lachnospiraceae bacterium]